MVLVSTGNSASCGKRQLEVVVMHQDHGIHRASLGRHTSSGARSETGEIGIHRYLD